MPTIARRPALRLATALALPALLAIGALPGSAVAEEGASAGAAPNAQDRAWVSDSSEGDLFEIAGGRLAATHSLDPAVRRFGRLMVRDHHQLYRATTGVADEVGLDTEDQPSRGQRTILRDWAGLTGDAFVCAYVPYEWEDHQLDIAESRDEVEDGASPAVVAAARAGLPVLRHHLAVVSRLLHDHHC
jgi:putative membrane protein